MATMSTRTGLQSGCKAAVKFVPGTSLPAESFITDVYCETVCVPVDRQQCLVVVCSPTSSATFACAAIGVSVIVGRLCKRQHCLHAYMLSVFVQGVQSADACCSICANGAGSAAGCEAAIWNTSKECFLKKVKKPLVAPSKGTALLPRAANSLPSFPSKHTKASMMPQQCKQRCRAA